MNDQWVKSSEMNLILGNKPGSSGFRTLLVRFPFLREEPFSRPGGHPAPEGMEPLEFNVEAVLAWDAKRPGKGNRTPGFKGTKENAHV